jgi:hypothetical protein
MPASPAAAASVLTYNRHPFYTYALETRAGQTRGEGSLAFGRQVVRRLRQRNEGRQTSDHHDHHDHNDRLRVPSLPLGCWPALEPRQSVRCERVFAGGPDSTFAQREVQWAHLGSNQGPPACEAGALPLSYAPGRKNRGAWKECLALLPPGPDAVRTLPPPRLGDGTNKKKKGPGDLRPAAGAHAMEGVASSEMPYLVLSCVRALDPRSGGRPYLSPHHSNE